MSARKNSKRLGRGLSSLIAEPVAVTHTEQDAETAQKPDVQSLSPKDHHNRGVLQLPLDTIIPNINQPRIEFDASSLSALAESIRVSGVLQPIVVRPISGGNHAHDGTRWELIAGERRWRAAKLAGLTAVPAIVHEATDREAAELALVENIQRADLNPVERARALKNLRDGYGLTQSQVAERVGLDRATVANLIRLTELEESVLLRLSNGQLTAGHGKALLSAHSSQRESLAARAVKEEWSVRRLEREAAPRDTSTARPSSEAQPPAISADTLHLEKQLGTHLGTKVRIKPNMNKTSGSITIQFYDLDHFEGLLEKMNYYRSDG